MNSETPLVRESSYVASLESRYEALLRAVEGVQGEWNRADRDRVKQEIIELFRETDGTLERLAALKERIRTLVDRFKAVSLARSDTAGGLAPARPRSDHLNSSTHIERGWSAIAAGEYEKAVEELRRALELAPDDPKAEGLLGWALMGLEQYDQALLTFHKVLMRDPNDGMARVNLGYICLKKQIFGESIEHLSRAIRLNNDRKATLYATFYMGLVYLEREMYEDARSFLRKALELGPGLIEAHWEMGRAFYLEGNEPPAAEAWRAGVEAGRFNPWGQRCAEAVECIESGQPVSLD
jgi:tetratricopeptide (TPR) repeat protein